MSVYGAYHRDARNRATHFVGVPIIIFAPQVAFGWMRLSIAGVTLSGAMLFVIIVHAYYFRLDIALATAMTVFSLVLLYFFLRKGTNLFFFFVVFFFFFFFFF